MHKFDILQQTAAKKQFILHITYYDYWCPGYTDGQRINSHGISEVILDYSSFSINCHIPIHYIQ